MKRGSTYRISGLIAAALAVVAMQGGAPALAHGAGVVKSCIQGTDCTTNSANNAVFAVCSPLNALTTCNPGRDVTIQLSGYPTSTSVNVWWLNSVVDNPLADDCSQALGLLGRTSLGTVTSSSTGTASLDVHLPPAGATVSTWSYGVNWLCATTASPGGSGAVGDQQFAIYPA